MRDAQESQSRPAPLTWFTQSTFRYTPLIVELMGVAAVIRILGLVQPFVFQAIVDRVLPFQREATLTLIVVVLVLVTLMEATMQALSAYLGNHMGNRLIAEMADRIFHHVLGLQLQFLQHWRVGEILARMGEINTVRAFLTGTISGYVLDVVFAAIYIGALLSISPPLTTVILIMLPLQMVAFGVMGPFLRRRMQASFAAGARHQSRLVETFANLITVKALASERRQAERLQETLEDGLTAEFRVAKLNIADGLVGDILENTSVILVLYFGSKLVFHNEITLGELIAFHQLSEKVAGPIMSLSTIWEQWQGIRIARLRLGDLLNTPVEAEAARRPLDIEGGLRLSLHGVSFGYAPGRPVIRELSAAIEPDQPTIIIGGSGTGKSTLAKLMSGLYTPDGGTIRANGQDINECDPDSVRRAIVYLPQEPVLFSGTVLENLLLARPDATELEIREALADSAADEVVAQLPGGLQTDVGERGGHLSGGQRQRIALARALLCDSSALVLDEPTSALDTTSAAIIITTLKRLSERRTIIVVTHHPELLGQNVNVLELATLQPFRKEQEMAELA